MNTTLSFSLHTFLLQLASSNSIHAEPIVVDGETHYKITDIIGKETGIGVENLKGSGLIAGRTSEAYEKTVTLNLVIICLNLDFF